MLPKHLITVVVLNIFILQIVSCAVLQGLLKKSKICETECEQLFSESAPDVRKSCSEGCRLYIVIKLAKSLNGSNTTTKLCETACSEAFVNESCKNACGIGCTSYPFLSEDEDEDVETLHLLTPLMYVRSAYNSMAHHVKQFISTSWTVYVQEDSGKMVILQTSPKVESVEYTVSRDDGNNLKDYQQGWQEAKLDWMDCISHQSGIPRWLLVAVLFGFIFALLWICCATAVTAPNQYLSSPKKKEVNYILVCETANEIPIKTPKPAPTDATEEAPPLPPKVSLI